MILSLFRFALATLLALAATAVSAQRIDPLTVEEDPNGVDLLSGNTAQRLPELSIPAEPRLSFNKISDWYVFLQGRLIPNTFGDLSF